MPVQPYKWGRGYRNGHCDGDADGRRLSNLRDRRGALLRGRNLRRECAWHRDGCNGAEDNRRGSLRIFQ